MANPNYTAYLPGYYIMELIIKYFPNLTSLQTDRFTRLESLYIDWNNRVNVISRKDMNSFYEHHVLHSLAISKFVKFVDNTGVIDVGTGGGFPGIPLAILFPGTKFTLVDSIGKKIKVVEEVAGQLDLENVTVIKARSNELKGNYDFVVGRGVSGLPAFVAQTRHLVRRVQQNSVTNGILYLKGGDFQDELGQFKKMVSVFNLAPLFSGEYFKTKKLVHISI